MRKLNSNGKVPYQDIVTAFISDCKLKNLSSETIQWYNKPVSPPAVYPILF